MSACRRSRGRGGPSIAGVQRIDVDGVPVFTASGPDRVTAALLFGVGIRDETYRTLGITHLVEHLVMGALPKSHLECNAMVDVESTTFMATGRPDRVAAFLIGVGAALANLPTDRIALETGVLEAEGCRGAHPTAAVLWGARFGLRGPGVAAAGGGVPGPLHVDDVLAHVRRWFVTGNAALAWHGPLPEGLRLSLPRGPRPVRSVPAARPQAAPVWTTGDTAGAGLLRRSAGPAEPALAVALDVLEERVREVARHQRGLSYSTDTVVVDVAAGHRENALVVDARPGEEAEVARLLWRQYLRLGDAGPTPAEVAHAVVGCAESAAGGAGTVAAELGRAAFCALFDLPVRTPADELDGWRSVTPQAAAAALRATRPTAVLAAPEGADLHGLPGGIDRRALCTRVPVLPAGRTFGPRVAARLTGRGRARLVVTDDVLGSVDTEGHAHVVPWREIAAVEDSADGRGLLVVGLDLCAVEVHEHVFGRRALAAVRSRLARGVPAAPEPVDALGARRPVLV